MDDVQVMQNDSLGRPDTRWVHVKVVNRSMPAWLKWTYDREPAFMCQAHITFHRMDGTKLYDREMIGRWNSLPEPELVVVSKDNGNYLFIKNYPFTIDIPSGSESSLAIAMRMRSDIDCYGFCNESYQYQEPENKWRAPEWKIGSGVFIARIRVVSNGREFVNAFRIVNDVRYEDFRLEPLNDPKLRKLLNLRRLRV